VFMGLVGRAGGRSLASRPARGARFGHVPDLGLRPRNGPTGRAGPLRGVLGQVAFGAAAGAAFAARGRGGGSLVWPLGPLESATFASRAPGPIGRPPALLAPTGRFPLTSQVHSYKDRAGTGFAIGKGLVT